MLKLVKLFSCPTGTNGGCCSESNRFWDWTCLQEAVCPHSVHVSLLMLQLLQSKLHKRCCSRVKVVQWCDLSPDSGDLCAGFIVWPVISNCPVGWHPSLTNLTQRWDIVGRSWPRENPITVLKWGLFTFVFYLDRLMQLNQR